MGDRAVWGVALSLAWGADGESECVQVVRFERLADVVEFVSAVQKRDDGTTAEVFDLETGIVVEPQFCSNDERSPFMTIFPRGEGRWRAIYPDETSDVMPSFEAVAG